MYNFKRISPIYNYITGYDNRIINILYWYTSSQYENSPPINPIGLSIIRIRNQRLNVSKYLTPQELICTVQFSHTGHYNV